jgi:ATP-dependent helicase STH1/SNF2
MNLDVDDIEPPAEDDESDAGKRLVIGPFIKLPPKRDYADYYVLISDPICMNQIEKKIKKMDYTSLSDLRKDFELMIRNCQTYNEDGSILYEDAKIMDVSAIPTCLHNRIRSLIVSPGFLQREV